MHATMLLGGWSLGHVYGDRAPILALAGTGLDAVTIRTAGATVITRDELHAAQSLRAAVETFAAEIERLATEQGVTS